MTPTHGAELQAEGGSASGCYLAATCSGADGCSHAAASVWRVVRPPEDLH